MAFEPENPHGHGHKTGLPWLDLIIAVSVVSISVISLVVSINHGQTMEKLVQENERMVVANTIPYLEVASSDYDAKSNKPRISLNLKNGGVGPALIDWLDIRYKGQSYSPGQLLKACCAPALTGHAPKGIIYSNVSGTVLPARETVDFLVADDTAQPATRDAISRMRQYISARACYCSVLEECSITDFGPGRPTRVKDCRVPPGVKPW